MSDTERATLKALADQLTEAVLRDAKWGPAATLHVRTRLLTALQQMQADFADRLDEALAVKNPDEAVARCWELVKELRTP